MRAEEPRYVRMKEICARLGVTRHTVHAYIAKGLLKARRLPSGQFRVTAAHLEEFCCTDSPDCTKCT